MRKLMQVSLVLALFIGVMTPVPTGAQYYNYGYTNNSAQIAQIQAELDVLKAKLNMLGYTSYNYNPNYSTGSVLGAYTDMPLQTGPMCSFTYDMSLGTSGIQVASLNQFLGVGSGSYFGQDTYNAVVRFQNQYAGEILYPAGLTYANGYVGSFTRAKLNALCNGVTSTGTVLGVSTYVPYYTTSYNNNYPYSYNYNQNQNNYNSAVPAGSGSGAPMLNFYANPPVVYGSGSTTLYWTTYNSSTCVASGSWSGTKANSGSEPVSGGAGGRTYTLTCANSNGDTVTQNVIVASIN